jgi:hypothetical protein
MGGIDFDYELSNGWDKWQNLVLTGMQEIKRDNKALETQMSNIGARVAVIESAAKTAENIVNTLQAQAHRLEHLEANSVSQDALKKERRWLVGISITVAGSIILPLVAVIMSVG